jgi:hypothetical protein
MQIGHVRDGEGFLWQPLRHVVCSDRDYAKAQGFEMKKLDSAIVARNTDGTLNTKGRITHYVELIMSLGSHHERQKFLITGLGKARLFISYDWLFKHNPEINWRDQKIVFSRCPEECNMSGTETQEGVRKDDLEEGESILLINFADTIELRAYGSQAQQMAEQVLAQKEKMTKDKIPEQYREFVKVFAKELFDSLPEKRP